MLNYRKPDIDDMLLYYDWANDPEVRGQSYDSNIIDLSTHKNWFESAIDNNKCFMYLFQDAAGNNVGQVRIQKQSDTEALIGISVASERRGKGYAKLMLLLSTDAFLKSNEGYLINAYIKEDNLGSKFSFEKSGFQFNEMVDYKNFRSFHYTKKLR